MTSSSPPSSGLDLLDELRVMVLEMADPLSGAHLAMTCRAEHEARVAMFCLRLSGPRTRASYYAGVAAHGTDDMLYRALQKLSKKAGYHRVYANSALYAQVVPCRHTDIDTRFHVIRRALQAGREAIVLRWCHDYPVATRRIMDEDRGPWFILPELSRPGVLALRALMAAPMTVYANKKFEAALLFHDLVADPARRRRLIAGRDLNVEVYDAEAAKEAYYGGSRNPEEILDDTRDRLWDYYVEKEDLQALTETGFHLHFSAARRLNDWDPPPSLTVLRWLAENYIQEYDHS